MHLVMAFFSGLLMAAGIAISGMIDPTKVLGFLTLSANWDPSLILVMASALLIYISGFQLLKKQASPKYAAQFHLPSYTKPDKSLVGGAAIFGAGWGLVGYCPGPALSALTSGSAGTIGFVVAMVLGWFAIHKMRQSKR